MEKFIFSETENKFNNMACEEQAKKIEGEKKFEQIKENLLKKINNLKEEITSIKNKIVEEVSSARRIILQRQMVSLEEDFSSFEKKLEELKNSSPLFFTEEEEKRLYEEPKFLIKNTSNSLFERRCEKIKKDLQEEEVNNIAHKGEIIYQKKEEVASYLEEVRIVYFKEKFFKINFSYKKTIREESYSPGYMQSATRYVWTGGYQPPVITKFSSKLEDFSDEELMEVENKGG